jgi:thymidylate synthase ThyX
MNGTNGISATIIADSISPQGVRITTMELEYPRFILAELNTHRMLSKNSSSSRAIPVATMLQQIRDKPATPVNWGRNRNGMQATEELRSTEREAVKRVWLAAMEQGLSHAAILHQIGLHKQIVNRVTEPWHMMKTVVTATEWANFLWLRDHTDAQPEIANLAFVMRCELERSQPRLLYPGEWHLPYISSYRHLANTKLVYSDGQGDSLTLEQALAVSASCCAQVSYRKNDTSLEKAQMIFDRLINSEPVHASPVEHQATPMVETIDPGVEWEPGVTHQTRNKFLWSGNFRGWIQHRKLLKNEARW